MPSERIQRCFDRLLDQAESLVFYAWFLLDRNVPSDHEKAIGMWDEATAIATEPGVKPPLERVLAEQEILKV